MFIEDPDRAEWGGLRDRLRLEAETRQFLAYPSARQVVAVTCALRREMLADAGELRFRIYHHDYEDVAAAAVWDAGQRDLPLLRAVIDAEISSHG